MLLVLLMYTSNILLTQVTLEKKALLDALFDESDTKRALDVVGGPAPGTMMVSLPMDR